MLVNLRTTLTMAGKHQEASERLVEVREGRPELGDGHRGCPARHPSGLIGRLEVANELELSRRTRSQRWAWWTSTSPPSLNSRRSDATTLAPDLAQRCAHRPHAVERDETREEAQNAAAFELRLINHTNPGV